MRARAMMQGGAAPMRRPRPRFLLLLASCVAVAPEAARPVGPRAAPGRECYRTPSAPKCVIVSDRHIPKTGGVTVRLVMRHMEQRGVCAMWPGFWQTPRLWTRAIGRIRRSEPELRRGAAMRLCVEAHATANYTGTSAATKMKKPAAKESGPQPRRYTAMHESLVSLRGWGQRTGLCRVVLAIRTREPLAYYRSYFMWRVLGPHSRSMQEWARTVPDLQAHAVYHNVDGNSAARIKRAGAIDAAALSRILRFIDSFDLAWPVERFDDGLRLLGVISGLDFGAYSGTRYSPMVRNAQVLLNCTDAKLAGATKKGTACTKAARETFTPCVGAHAAPCAELIARVAPADTQMHAYVVHTFEAKWRALWPGARDGGSAARAARPASAHDSAHGAAEAALNASTATAAAATAAAAAEGVASGPANASDVCTSPRGRSAARRVHMSALVCDRQPVYLRNDSEADSGVPPAAECMALLDSTTNPCMPAPPLVSAVFPVGNSKLHACPPHCMALVPSADQGHKIRASEATGKLRFGGRVLAEDAGGGVAVSAAQPAGHAGGSGALAAGAGGPVQPAAAPAQVKGTEAAGWASGMALDELQRLAHDCAWDRKHLLQKWKREKRRVHISADSRRLR